MADDQEKVKPLSSPSSASVRQDVASSPTIEKNSTADQDQGIDQIVIPTAMECEEGGEPSPLINCGSDTIADSNTDCASEDDKISSVSFPVFELARLDEMISNPRWVVPVLPGSQLEVLLDAAINLCKKGMSSYVEFKGGVHQTNKTLTITK